MLLACEYKQLLRDERNEEAVVSILTELAMDVLPRDMLDERQALKKRLKEMGEIDIYRRLTK